VSHNKQKIEETFSGRDHRRAVCANAHARRPCYRCAKSGVLCSRDEKIQTAKMPVDPYVIIFYVLAKKTGKRSLFTMAPTVPVSF
jgi:hypothetical protein